MNVTPAAIAQQVRKLEAHVGTALVRREGRGLVLTPAGAELARPLTEAFTLISSSMDRLQQREAARGVRVSTTEYFVQSVILPNLVDFWARHPATQVSFSPDGNQAPVDLEGFDIAIRGGAPDQRWEGCSQTVLVETPFVICVAPKLFDPDGMDLSDLPWIRDSSLGGQVFERGVRQAGCDPDRILIVDPGSSKFDLDAALMGLGVHLGPELTIRHHVETGALVRVDRALELRAVYYALYRDALMPKSVRTFLDWLIPVCRAF
jgi:LysR family glycine cleavage system transcriptional activator